MHPWSHRILILSKSCRVINNRSYGTISLLNTTGTQQNESPQGGSIISQTQEKTDDTELGPLPDFAALGVRKSVRSSLRRYFPNIRTPTACQTEFIPAVLQRKDVVLRDRTGSGKTLGLILALLSKERATRPYLSFKERSNIAKRPITSLVIVPHRDLAYQLMQWIRILCPHNLEASLDSIGQVCVRGDKDMPIDAQIHKLRAQAPHVLIGTPQAILEIMEKDKTVLQIPTLDTVVVDEADYLLPVPEPNAPKKKWLNWEAHPPPTLTIMNELFASRSKKHRERNAFPWRYPIQTVFSSATFKRHLRHWLFNRTDWLNGVSKTARIDFGDRDGNPGVKHYALVIDKVGGVRNSKIAREGVEAGQTTKSTSKTQEVSAYMLEAIATAFAVDVPRIALLILPATSPVVKTVDELKELGINARSLGLQDDERGKAELMASKLNRLNPGRRVSTTREPVEEPDLLVTTLKTIRGLDFPELTHVFIGGLPESVEEYAHAAGRVGRFGREGKVIMFLEKGDERKAGSVYKELDISLSEFEI